MQSSTRTVFLLATGLALAACGGDDSSKSPGPDAGSGGDTGDFSANSCASLMGKDANASCMQINSGDDTALRTAANTITDNTTLVLAGGTFTMTDQLTLRNKSVHIIGQGIDKTTLDFSTVTTQGNGIDSIGDNFLVQDLTVLDAPKDGIRVEASNGVVYRRIRATWKTASNPNNGAYGIYPVKSQNVLVEDSKAENASDSGLYVGQCQHVVVRNNTVQGNVAGLEIENTEYADVYGNEVTDNAGGLVVFDLPGNPIVGRDIQIHDNNVHDNNHVNFAMQGSTVASVPTGTGTFAMASRRVAITNNMYMNNNTVDVALISGLALDSDITHWTLPAASEVGDYQDLDVVQDGNVINFRGENIVVSGNTHMGSGKSPPLVDPLMFGVLLIASYGQNPVDSVIYDAIGESMFDSTDPAKNTNDNHMCVGGETSGTFASLDLAAQSATTLVPFFRPAAPFAPFDCTAIMGPAIAPVTLPTTLP
jgi:parallel beta-helix repeat protein